MLAPTRRPLPAGPCQLNDMLVFGSPGFRIEVEAKSMLAVAGKRLADLGIKRPAAHATVALDQPTQTKLSLTGAASPFHRYAASLPPLATL